MNVCMDFIYRKEFSLQILYLQLKSHPNFLFELSRVPVPVRTKIL